MAKKHKNKDKGLNMKFHILSVKILLLVSLISLTGCASSQKITSNNEICDESISGITSDRISGRMHFRYPNIDYVFASFYGDATHIRINNLSEWHLPMKASSSSHTQSLYIHYVETKDRAIVEVQHINKETIEVYRIETDGDIRRVIKNPNIEVVNNYEKNEIAIRFVNDFPAINLIHNSLLNAKDGRCL